MKKNTNIIAALAAAFLASVSCTKMESPTPAESGEGNYTVCFQCSMPDTKTAFHENTIWWSAEDKIRFCQYATVLGSKKIKSAYGTVDKEQQSLPIYSISTFNTPDVDTEAQYFSIYPSDAYQAITTSAGALYTRLLLNSVQHPGADSFDPESDILISGIETEIEKNSEGKFKVLLQYTRPSAIAKMTVTNLPSSSPLASITFSAKKGTEDIVLAGSHCYDLGTGTRSTTVTTSSCFDETEITLDYSLLDTQISAKNGMTAYFCCYPFSLEAGDSFRIVVTTASGEAFAKEITIPAGRRLEFKAGEGSRFSVDMGTSVKAVASALINGETSAYYTLESAIAAANGKTASIRLMDNCTLSADINPSSTSTDITMDLAGKTISESPDTRIKLTKGKFTVNDSVGSGTILLQSTDKSAANAMLINGAEVVINGANIINETSGNGIHVNSGNLTFNQGTVTTSGYPLYIYGDTASVTINGGSFKNEYSGTTQALGSVVRNAMGMLTVNNGYFYTCCTASSPLCFTPGISTATETYYSRITEAYLNTSVINGWKDSGSTIYSGTYNHSHNGEALVYTRHIKPAE